MRVKGLVFAGLDIETTGSDVNTAGICQIGVFLEPGVEFVSDIRPAEGTIVQAEALKVNGFTLDRLINAPFASGVDVSLSDFLAANGVNEKRLVSIGWNVAGFDLPFVKKFLPLTAAYLSYRTVDLNAVCFTINPFTWEDTKQKVKEIAEREILYSGGQTAWHDALYDAKAAYLSWQALRDEIAGVQDGAV